MFRTASLADLPAFLCGHAQNPEAATGCTVVVAPEGAVCGVDVRGGGPATRETDLLRPENMIEAVHAVVLAGGSAFGLAASTGVMDELAARGIGFPVEGARVPIVVGAC
ncbi:MAG: P1 family peptidase, partial [Gordonibacter urolithinfaciens]